MTAARAAAAAALCVALATACTATKQTDTGGRHPWTVPGLLRIGFPDEPDSLNPMYGHTAATDEADALIFAPVFRYDQTGRLLPELAVEVPTYANGDISQDGKTIVLRWRRGARWADGAPLTPRDLRFTWRAVMNPRNNVKTRDGWDDIATIDVPNDATAIVHLKQPNADVLGIFATGGAAYPPLPEHLLGKLPDLNRAAFNAAPLASGPFALERWNHGSSLEFVPNPRYWRGPPRLRHITWRVIPNADSQFAELQTHEIDVYPNVSTDQVARLATIPGISVTKRLVANLRHLEFNTRKPALADARVRRAIAEGVDWDRINDTVYLGLNQRAVSDIMPASWAAPRIAQWRYDQSDARKLLDDAGFKLVPGDVRVRGGVPLRVTISTGTNNPSNERAELQIQQELHGLGIDVTIKNYPVSYLFAQNGPLYGGTYDLSWTVDTEGPDPDNQANWSGDFIPPHGANTTFYNDPVITAASEAAIRTFDPDKRRMLYQREEERIHDLALAVFFYWENATSAYNSDLRNYRPAQYIADNWNAWEWEI